MLNNSKLLAGIAAVAALVSASGVFAADAKGALYGDLRWSLDYADDKDPAVQGPGYSATDNNSYWGIKASISERGITAFGQYDRFLSTDSAGGIVALIDLTRQTFVGLSSGLGTVKYGRFETDYYQVGRKMDLFNNTTVSGVGGLGAGTIFSAGNSHGQSALLNGNFLGSGISANQVSYMSPNFAGITVNAAFFMDDAGTGAAQDHDYGGGVEFNNFGITAGVQALDFNSGGTNFAAMAPKEDAVRAYAGYGAKNFGANVSVERVDFDDDGGAPVAQYYFASAWFGILPGTRLAASVGSENETGAEGDSVSLGVFHDVIENFTTWVAARRFDGKGAVDGGRVEDVVTMGVSYKFDFGFGK